MTKKSYVAENGITVGLAVLALLVIFAIALPRWTHNHLTKAIDLPDSLSNGLAAVDANTDPRIGQVIDAFSTLDTSATKALDAAAASKVYANKTTGATLVVQAVRAPGGSALMLSQPFGKVSKIGNDTCIDVSGQSGSEAICRRSQGELTIQVAGSGTAAEIDGHLNEIWSKVS